MKRCIFFIVVMLVCFFTLAAAQAEGTITLPANLNTIEAEAFIGDTSLGRVIVPEGTTRIESKAFANSSVTEITLPGSITFIAADAFEGCKNVVIDAKKDTYAYNWAVKEEFSLIPSPAPAKDFEYELKRDKITITDYLGSGGYVVIPDEINGNPVTSIGSYAFVNDSNVTKVRIPDTVTELGYGVFYNCQNLTAAYLSSNIDTIGDMAFSCCSSLKSIDIPYGVTSLDDSLFSFCLKLNSITIPGGVTSIGNNTFRNCKSLINITLPKTVTTIDHRAFVGCSALTSIIIPENVAFIGNGAFSECGSLKEINVASANDTYSSSQGVLFSKNGKSLLHYPAGKTQSEYIIPDNVNTIGFKAFGDCTSLASIILPNSITTIEEDAFWGCSSLTNVTIPDSVISIEEYTFCDCTSMTSVTIPSSVTSIGDDAFYNCSNLTIYGVSGSYAEEYAGEYQIPFKPISMPEVRITSPSQTDDYIREAGVNDENSFISLSWSLSDMPECAYVMAGFMPVDVSTADENAHMTKIDIGINSGTTLQFGNNDIPITSRVMGYKAVVKAYSSAGAVLARSVKAITIYASEADYKDKDNEFGALFTVDNTIQNNELILKSADMSLLAYDRVNCAQELEAYGFKYITHYDYDSPEGDHVGRTYGVRTSYNDNGEIQRVYAIIVRGSTGANEWLSNFNLGTDAAVHHGIMAATDEMYRTFESYRKTMEKIWPVDPANSRAWITGHSRGGAVGSFYAAVHAKIHFSADHIYCHTFAAPNYDMVVENTEYVFNFVNPADLIPNVPMWDFQKNGQTIPLWSSDSNLNSHSETLVIVTTAAEHLTREFVNGCYEFAKPMIEDMLEKNAELHDSEITATDVFSAFFDATIDVVSFYGTLKDVLTGEIFYKEGVEYTIEKIMDESELVQYINKIGITHDMKTYKKLIEDMYDK